MEQKDIDKLLACRKAIDDHLIRKANARSIQESTLTASKATAYTTMQNTFSDSRDIYLAILIDNGFGAVDAFMKFNRDMCINSIRENITFTGKCAVSDGCTGCFDAGIVPLNFQYKPGNLCFYSADAKTLNSKYDWQAMLFDLPITQGRQFDKNEDGTFRLICPPGVGYTITIKKLPFDLYWK